MCLTSFNGTLRPVRLKGCTDVTAELQKLADLHKSGILTDEEFAATKKKLLGLLGQDNLFETVPCQPDICQRLVARL
ncbi:MAG TPA: SHOCT domain-containing protein [archaeon]